MTTRGPTGHDAWNSRHYPGTRQLCTICDQPTGRCEDDSILDGRGLPICEECNELLLLRSPPEPQL